MPATASFVTNLVEYDSHLLIGILREKRRQNSDWNFRIVFGGVCISRSYTRVPIANIERIVSKSRNNFEILTVLSGLDRHKG